MIDLKDLALDTLLDAGSDESPSLNFVEQTDAAAGKVAVIGMAGSIGAAADLDAFWDRVAQGWTGRRALPEARLQDFEDYLRLRGQWHRVSEEDYLQETFLEEIDKFDHRFFGLSRQEANLMDPNQRLFLQTAWRALENAGYGGVSIRGSNTGVFVGHSADFGQDYRHIVQTFAPDAPEISVAGNIKSIIASRIAYHLDLHGPSMLIDTACSSGLVSLHHACRSLRNGECGMAIAGAVKIDLLPIEDKDNSGVGTRDIQDTIAHDGKTKTFDERCDGTSAAEGVLAFILKPLQNALDDGDHIHAVIAGSAVNQDGLSVGITAPNSAAQEALIVAALEDAGIAAEEVGYIEAHGTATRLGDPIEVSGIQRAFAHYTQRKQFCAIGSVKSNIGHMDNAAGLAGLAKVIGSLTHAQLPPSLHFHCPNQNIAFEQSPVFVNDRLCDWPANPNGKRIAGINSFGLSGTNCHVLVSNPPVVEAVTHAETSPALFLLSAKSPEQLERYARECLAWLSAQNNADQRLTDICFTLATGRLHHNHRLAILVSTREELTTLLGRFIAGEDDKSVSVSHFRLLPQASDVPGEISEAQQLALGREAEALLTSAAPDIGQLEKLCDLYSRGAAIDWNRVFPKTLGYRRVPLPGYPFARQRCWVEISDLAKRRAALGGAGEKQFAHPLLDRTLATSHGLKLYATALSAKRHWELADHRVKGQCILPGTAYLEMLLAIIRENSPEAMPEEGDWTFTFERMQFMSPFVVAADETRELHVQLQGEFPRYEIRLVSGAGGDWLVHAEALLSIGAGDEKAVPVALATLKERLTQPINFARSDDQRRGLDIGDRWNHAFVEGWHSTEKDEFLVELALPEQYANERSLYHYHPALMDVAVNAANHLLADDQLFLPFAYRNFRLFAPLPAHTYVHLRRKQQSTEMANFSVQLLNEQGEVVSTIEDYAVKRVPESELKSGRTPSQAYDVRMVPMQQPVVPDSPIPERLLLILDQRSRALPLVQALLTKCRDGVEIMVDEADPDTLLQHLSDTGQASPFNGVVYACSLGVGEVPSEMVDTMHRLGTWLSGLMQKKIPLQGPCFVLTRQALMADGDAMVEPAQAALHEFARIAAMENPQLKLVAVDLAESDLQTSDTHTLAPLWRQQVSDSPLLCLRSGNAFVEELYASELPDSGRFSVRDGGVYLITGGTGSLGLALAKAFALEAKESGLKEPIHLILGGSRALPPYEAWAQLAQSEGDEKTRTKFQTLLEIASTGAGVEAVTCDMADEAEVKGLLERIRKQYGGLHGVVHAAGRAGAGFIVNKSPEQLAEVVLPKAAGAWWLHRHTQHNALDFFVLYSSIATVLRNAGQSDYTAANRFLDALAQQRRADGLPATSVRWPAWREIGIAVEFNAVDEEEFFVPIDTDDGLTRLRTAMANAAALPAAFVLADINRTATLQDLTKAHLLAGDALQRLLQSQKPAAADATSVAGDQAVTLKGVAEPDEMQLVVAKLWRKVLGATEIAIDDHFSDLGGNSILTTQLYNEYEALYPGAMDMADLFTHTTIDAQAKQLGKALGVTLIAEKKDESASEDIDDILRRLSSGELSAEEAGSML